MAETQLKADAPVPTASLEDKYLVSGRVFMTGYQALVRLLLIQRNATRLSA
jgi:indolepyruvate ferredoxin oxidoreductase